MVELKHLLIIGPPLQAGCDLNRLCNLYNVTKGPQAILEFTRAMQADVGNLQPARFARIIRDRSSAPLLMASANWCGLAGECHRHRRHLWTRPASEPISFEPRARTPTLQPC
jgi:hypothetical protein